MYFFSSMIKPCGVTRILADEDIPSICVFSILILVLLANSTSLPFFCALIEDVPELVTLPNKITSAAPEYKALPPFDFTVGKAPYVAGLSTQILL